MQDTTIHLNWQPDAQSKTPVYQQIVDYFIQQIQAGNWPLHAVLPPRQALSVSLNTDFNTVLQALDALQEYGVITTDSAHQSQIASNSWATLMNHDPLYWQGYVQSKAYLQKPPSSAVPAALTSLSNGEIGPEMFPKTLLQNAMHRVADGLTDLNYLPALGLLALRQHIADRLNRIWGLDIDVDNILITSGSLQSLQMITVSLLAQDSEIYTAPASYLQSLKIFEAVNAQFKELPLDEEGLQYWRIKPSAKPQMLYLIPTFDNPLGTVMSAKRRADLVQFAQAHQLPVVEDTAYQDIWLDEQPPQPIKALDTQGNVIYIGSISKSLAPGLRVGWIVSSKALIHRLAGVKKLTDYGASSLAQMTLAQIYADPGYDAYLNNLRQALKQKRDAALAVLKQELGGIATWNQPEGGFYIWLTFPDTVSVDQLVADLAQQNIAVNPGSMYGPHAQQCMRLSFAYLTQEALAKGLKALAAAVHHQLD